MDAAIAFYTEVIGWKTMPFEGGDKPYTMWANGERPIGGVMNLPEEAKKMGAPPHWLAYVYTADVDDTAKQIEALGGKLLSPMMDIPTVGRFVVFADPQGSVLAAFTPDKDAPETEKGVGDIGWAELMTSDHEAAFSFYEKLFGWEKAEAMDMGEMGTYQLYGRKGKHLGGMMNRPPNMTTSAWLYYATVDGLDAALERATSRGAKILNGPQEVPGEDWIAQIMDPQGVAFALHSKKR